MLPAYVGCTLCGGMQAAVRKPLQGLVACQLQQFAAPLQIVSAMGMLLHMHTRKPGEPLSAIEKSQSPQEPYGSLF